MPMFVVSTNVAKDAVPSTLLSETTEELAKAMGKPAQVGQNHTHSCTNLCSPGFYYDPKPELLLSYVSTHGRVLCKCYTKAPNA